MGSTFSFEILVEKVDLQEEMPIDFGLPTNPVETKLSIESLEALPDELVAKMKEATVNGYMKRLDELLDEVEGIDRELAAGLRSLSKRYEYGALVQILEGRDTK